MIGSLNVICHYNPLIFNLNHHFITDLLEKESTKSNNGEYALELLLKSN